MMIKGFGTQILQDQNTKTLKYVATFVLLSGFFPAKAQDLFQLAPPFMRYPSVFFEKETAVVLQFAQAGTQIHYTTNGQDPTEKDPVYVRPIVLKKHRTTLKAKVFGTGLLPSDPVGATFYKKGLPILAIQHPPPHPSYPGSGPSTLMDGKGGVVATDSNTWMGFKSDTVSITLRLTKPQKVKQVLLHLLKNQGAWIFLPQKVELWGRDARSGDWMPMGTSQLDPSQKDGRAACHALVVDADKKVKTNEFVVKIYALAQIPAWHPGKGTLPWLFLDEVKLY